MGRPALRRRADVHCHKSRKRRSIGGHVKLAAEPQARTRVSNIQARRIPAESSNLPDVGSDGQTGVSVHRQTFLAETCRRGLPQEKHTSSDQRTCERVGRVNLCMKVTIQPKRKGSKSLHARQAKGASRIIGKVTRVSCVAVLTQLSAGHGAHAHCLMEAAGRLKLHQQSKAQRKALTSREHKKA